MIHRMLVASILLLVPCSSTIADEPDEAAARKVVERALNAVGGKEKLISVKALTFNYKAAIYQPRFVAGVTLDEQNAEASGSVALAASFKVRVVNKWRFSAAVTNVISGDQGWTKSGDSIDVLDRKALREWRRSVQDAELLWLIPFARGDEEIELSLAGERKVGDRPSVCVEVTRPNHPTTRLSFDKESALLLQVEEKTILKITRHILLNDYKDVNGLKVATKYTERHNGYLYRTLELDDLQIVERLDDKLFEQP